MNTSFISTDFTREKQLNKLYLDGLCIDNLCLDKLCLDKLCLNKLCLSIPCLDKLCTNKLHSTLSKHTKFKQIIFEDINKLISIKCSFMYKMANQGGENSLHKSHISCSLT